MSDPTSPLAGDLRDAGWPQISEWLVGTDIEFAEISGPDWIVRMVRETGYLPQQTPDSGRQTTLKNHPASARSAGVNVTATVAGVFLDRHPLRSSALVLPGTQVHKGDIVGLIQVGAVLAPVIAPVDGVMAGNLLAPGKLAGFGTPLVQIIAGEVPWK